MNGKPKYRRIIIKHENPNLKDRYENDITNKITKDI